MKKFILALLMVMAFTAQSYAFDVCFGPKDCKQAQAEKVKLLKLTPSEAAPISSAPDLSILPTINAEGDYSHVFGKNGGDAVKTGTELANFGEGIVGLDYNYFKMASASKDKTGPEAQVDLFKGAEALFKSNFHLTKNVTPRVGGGAGYDFIGSKGFYEVFFGLQGTF